MRTIIDDKRGNFAGLLYAIVTIAALGFVILIGGYIANTFSDELQTKIASDTPEVNESFQATKNVANNTLSAVWYVVFAGLILGLMITAWYIPTHPIFAAPFIVLLIITVIIGVALSNVYQKLYGVSQFSSIASTQGSVNFILSNLPYVALVIGIIVLIITFAKPGKGGAAPTA